MNNELNKRCIRCDGHIPAARLAILPGTTVCVSCSARNPGRRPTARDVDLSQASIEVRNGFGLKT